MPPERLKKGMMEKCGKLPFRLMVYIDGNMSLPSPRDANVHQTLSRKTIDLVQYLFVGTSASGKFVVEENRARRDGRACDLNSTSKFEIFRK